MDKAYWNNETSQEEETGRINKIRKEETERERERERGENFKVQELERI